MTGLVTLGLRRVPLALKAAVVADAESRDSSVRAVVTDVLARRLGVDVDPGHGPTRRPPRGAAPSLQVLVPRELKDALRERGEENGLTYTDAALSLLAAHYGVEWSSRASGRTAPGGGGRPRTAEA